MAELRHGRDNLKSVSCEAGGKFFKDGSHLGPLGRCPVLTLTELQPICVKGSPSGVPGLREPRHPAAARPKAERKELFGSGGPGSLGASQKWGPHHDADTPSLAWISVPRKYSHNSLCFSFIPFISVITMYLCNYLTPVFPAKQYVL